jgi:hypothetical protein
MNAAEIFDTVAEELCVALQNGDVISRLVQKEIETPAGLLTYAEVLTNFGRSEDNGRRKLAKHLLRVIEQERLSLSAALASIDVEDMWRA